MKDERLRCEYSPDELTVRKVKGHYELVDRNGHSVVSADTRYEIETELEALIETYENEKRNDR